MTRSSPTLPLDLTPSPKLYAKTPQYDANRCQFCGDVESPDRPFVAVLTYVSKDHRHWLHKDQCLEKHSERIRSEREQHYREKERAA